MKTIELKDMLENDEMLNKTLFHFAPKANYEVINREGFKAEIGQNDMNIEENPKVFFTQGPINLLRIADVWIRWISWHVSQIKYFGKNDENWSNEKFAQLKNDFASGDIFTEDVLSETYKRFFDMCRSFEYYTFDLDEGVDFSFDDIDEVKAKHLHNGVLSFSPAFMKMYGPYSNFTSIKTDGWNLHTFPSKGVTLDKLSHVVSNEYGSDFNMLDMILEVRRKCLTNPEKKKQVSELTFLNDFLEKTESLEDKSTMSM